MRTFVRAVDGFSKACGILAAVLVIVLIVLMLYDVGMRYIFNSPTLWGFDVNTWLMGASFILSVGYALSRDNHVRVDLLYSSTTRHYLRYVDLIGFIFILLPAAIWISWGLWHYFAEAFKTGERSGSSAWNPVLWPFRLILFIGFLSFTIQIVAEIIKRIYSVLGMPIEGDTNSDHGTV